MESAKKRRKITSKQREIMDLPEEVLETIFLKLSKYDVYRNLALVCRRFLKITRGEVFAPNVKLKYDLNGRTYCQSPIYKFPEIFKVCTRKMENVLKIYAKSTFHLLCSASFDQRCKFEHCDKCTEYDLGDPLLIGYSWMKEFLPVVDSITKLTLALHHLPIENHAEFTTFKNLTCLEITVQSNYESLYGNGQNGIEDLEAEFWNFVPNLHSLKVVSNHIIDCVS